MKQVKTFSDEIFILTDEQSDQVKQALSNGNKYLEIGEVFIALSSVKMITPLEKKPYAMGYPMTDDCRFVIQNGEKKGYSGGKDRIEWRESVPEGAMDLRSELNLEHGK